MGRNDITRYLLPGIGFLVLPLVIRSDYHLHLVIFVLMNAILGMGFSIIWKNHLITCGQAGFWAVGAYTSALLVMRGGWSFWLALPTAGLTSALFASIVFAVALRAGPLTFFGMSLVSSFIIMELLGTVEFFGGWEGIMGISSPTLGTFTFFSKISYYYLILVLLGLNILVFRALYRSRIGRAWASIGSSVRLAQVQGINVYRYRLAAAVIACFFAGLAGAFYAHYQNLLVPTTFGFTCSIYIQMYALIGGLRHPIAGPIVGAAVMVIAPEVFRMAQEFQSILYAILLIAIIIFLPGGLLEISDLLPALGRLFSRDHGAGEGIEK